MKVLIVEDSNLIRERLVEMISDIAKVEIVGQEGYAPKAIASIQKLQPDVVILDIRLRDGNGFEVLESIKKGHKPPVVIMLTKYPYPSYREKCLALGADFFLDKATEFEKVAVILQELEHHCHLKRKE